MSTENKVLIKRAISAIIHGQENLETWDGLNTAFSKGGKTEAFNALIFALRKAIEEQGLPAIWAKIKGNTLKIT